MKTLSKLFKLLLVFGMFLSSGVFAQGLTFSYANAQLIGTGPYLYEVYVMIKSDVAATKLGDTQVYLNYNSLAFGDSVVSRGKVTVFKSSLTNGTNGTVPLYTLQNVVDHDKNRIAVTFTYDFDSNTGLANEVLQVEDALFRIQIEIENRAWLSGISFEQNLMTDQQFLADNFIQYQPIDASAVSDIVLGVETVQNNIIPTEFKMDQNYPNPFNPETTVRFDLPASLGGENVTLIIYDMLGRKVRTLQDGPLSAGTYELKWDGKTESGADLASGTYLLRLQAKRQQQIIKMLLMK